MKSLIFPSITLRFDYILNCGDFTFISYDDDQSEEEKKEKVKLFDTIKDGRFEDIDDN